MVNIDRSIKNLIPKHSIILDNSIINRLTPSSMFYWMYQWLYHQFGFIDWVINTEI